LVAGHAPVRAKKLKYYEDHNFTSRILPPPELHLDGYRDRPPMRSDDWTGRPLPKAPVSTSRSAPSKHSFDDDGGLNRSLPLDRDTPERSSEREASPLHEGSQ